VNGIYVKSGDDALAIGGEPSEASLAANPEGISDLVASNINVYSSHGNAVKVYSVAGSAWNTVTRVRVHGVVGSSGVLRNGGVAVRDDNNTAAGTSQISDVQVTGVSLALGSASHDGTQPYGTYIKSSSSVKVEAAYSITASGVGQNFTAERIEKSFDVQTDTKVAAYPVRGATYIDSCDLVRSRHSGETVTGTLLQPFGTVLNSTRLTFNDTDWSLNYTSAGGNAGISLTDSEVSFENVKVRGARSGPEHHPARWDGECSERARRQAGACGRGNVWQRDRRGIVHVHVHGCSWLRPQSGIPGVRRFVSCWRRCIRHRFQQRRSDDGARAGHGHLWKYER
jgi:hypothetical protein